MQTFRNQLKTDEAALTAADIGVIFCGIQELQEARDLFVAELQPLVDDFSFFFLSFFLFFIKKINIYVYNH